MNSPSTFFGKCVILLIGGGLSFATVSSPEVAEIAGVIFGPRSTPQPLGEVPSHAKAGFPADLSMSVGGPQQAAFASRHHDRNHDRQPAEVSGTTAVMASPAANVNGTDRLSAISTRLRQLGASYLLLEKLPQPDGESYRVRCDVAQGGQMVKCYFEATRPTALEAMEEILQAVLRSRPTTSLQDVPTVPIPGPEFESNPVRVGRTTGDQVSTAAGVNQQGVKVGAAIGRRRHTSEVPVRAGFRTAITATTGLATR